MKYEFNHRCYGKQPLIYLFLDEIKINDQYNGFCVSIYCILLPTDLSVCLCVYHQHIWLISGNIFPSFRFCKWQNLKKNECSRDWLFQLSVCDARKDE